MFKGPTNIWPKGADGPLSILSGQTVVLPCGSTRDYSSITIEAGGTLEVGPGNGWTIIGCSGNCTINGKVIARGGFGAAQTVGGVEVRRSTYTAEAPDKTQLSYSVYHSRGGAQASYVGPFPEDIYTGGAGGDGGGGGGAAGDLGQFNRGLAHSPTLAGTDLLPSGKNGVSQRFGTDGSIASCSGASAGSTNGVGVSITTTAGSGSPNTTGRGGNSGKAGGGGGISFVNSTGGSPAGGDSDDVQMIAGKGSDGFLFILSGLSGSGGGGGRHGQGLFLRVRGSTVGSGSVDANGCGGGGGGIGFAGESGGGKVGYEATPGGSGGGGGSGGKIKLIAANRLDSWTLLANGALGGAGGAGGRDNSTGAFATSGNAGENGEAGTVEVN